MPRITTGAGDDGTTRLSDGSRVPKDDARVDACGCVDELTSYIGLVVSVSSDESITAYLITLQKDLYLAAADIASPPSKGGKRLTRRHIYRVDALIREVETSLPDLGGFVLPGGCELAAHLHVARAIARRAERRAASAHRSAGINPEVLVYLNRVSDLLFLLARRANASTDTPETYAAE